MKGKQIVAIDVGSTNVVIAVGAVMEDGRVDILGITSEPVQGVNAGRVENSETVGRAVHTAKERIEQELGIKITEAYAGLSGDFIRCEQVSDHVYVQDEQNNGSFQITSRDLENLDRRMQSVKLPDDREEIIPKEPLRFKVDGKEYFNERPISTVQSSAIYVAQMRDWLPDYIGGVLWFGNDDANMVALTPIYSCLEAVPDCYSGKLANATTFSFRNAYWVCNWVSNMVYYRYNLLFPELQSVRDRLEKDFNSLQATMENKAKELGEVEGKKYLSDYSLRMAGMMMDEWMQLAQKLIVKYNDMCIKKVDEQGNYILTPGGEPIAPDRPGYPEEYRRKMVEESGDKYLLK